MGRRTALSRTRSIIITATSDMFIQSRMNELANSLGLRTEFTVNESELKTLASSHPRLLILDLAAEDYDAISIAKALKQQPAHPIMIGFYPHVRRDLEAAAKSAGVDIVVPNSNLLTVVRRFLQKEASND